MAKELQTGRPIWLVRAGRRGQREEIVLENNIAAICWKKLGDLTNVESKEDLIARFEKVYPDKKMSSIMNEAGQAWRFRHEMQIGDTVVLPLKTEPSIAVGVVASGYKYTTEYGDLVTHVRGVEWIVKDMPRTWLEQDLLYSMSTDANVTRIRLHDAETRLPEAVNKYIKGLPPEKTVLSLLGEGEEEAHPIDLETVCRDQIRTYMAHHFCGQCLQDLVASIFEVEGYVADTSPRGKDHGADILMGHGILGLEEPRICVRVMASPRPVGADAVNNLLCVVSS